MPIVRVATCTLNQWALDFVGNLERTKASIAQAKRLGAKYRLGPELELTGYGCEDHFFEADTIYHAWESLAELLRDDDTDGILCDIGMPVMHRGVRYNCRVFCLNGRILLVRPKLYLADDGNYREGRWFTAWTKRGELEELELPEVVSRLRGQETAPFGVGVLSCHGVTVSSETCEELFTPMSPHIGLGLQGVDIIGNGSGSHHQLRKLHQRVDLIRSATAKGGGVYLYSNQQGCDGSRVYYDGSALVACNGELLAQSAQFSVRDVDVVCATVDLNAVRSYRSSIASRGEQARSAPSIPHLRVPFRMTAADGDAAPSMPEDPRYHTPEEEIALGPACWLWDYLRRSGASGYFLPLSGGADSSATATLVGIMCHLVVDAVKPGEPGREQVLSDIRRITHRGLPDSDSPGWVPTDPQQLCNDILHTAYLGTAYSSGATQARAKALAGQLGAYHLYVVIDTIISAVLALMTALLGKTPQFYSRGGSLAEDIALQNLQARLRMVLSYMLAQLLPWVRGRRGFLLVLGSSNVDEGLRGYLTKYDCSAADLNPIGSVAKIDLRLFLAHAAKTYGYSSLLSVVKATPTAELRPIVKPAAASLAVSDSVSTAGAADAPDSADEAGEGGGGETEGEEHSQTDEADMGMSYEELRVYGRLRKVDRLGPLFMFRALRHRWAHLPPAEVADKVKRFFWYYGINRHKSTVLPPAYHAESYSPDDNRFDLRQFLYPRWTAQFRAIDADVRRIESKAATAALAHST